MRADEARKEQRRRSSCAQPKTMMTGAMPAAPRPCSGSCSSTHCDYRTAQRIVRASEALRSLPALDEALGAGELTLDQTVAAAELATPETDAELARIAVGRAPREIERLARVINPPLVADDQALYARRGLRMTWTGGARELKFSGSLPLEQGVAFEQAIWDIAKPSRALDKKSGSPGARMEPVLRRRARHTRHPTQQRRR